LSATIPGRGNSILAKSSGAGERLLGGLTDAIIRVRRGGPSRERRPGKPSSGIEKGFDFLGYHFDRERLTAAKATVERFVERATRLYEQRLGEPEGSRRLGMHVRRWAQWVRAGLGAPLRSAHGTANAPLYLRPPFTRAPMALAGHS
jgi:hypothetical protein